MTQDVCAHGARAATAHCAAACAAEHGAQQSAQIKAAQALCLLAATHVTLQRAHQGIGTAGLLRVLAHLAQQHGQSHAHGATGLLRAGAQLLSDLLQRRALQLLPEFVGEGCVVVIAHGMSFSDTKKFCPAGTAYRDAMLCGEHESIPMQSPTGGCTQHS